MWTSECHINARKPRAGGTGLPQTAVGAVRVRATHPSRAACPRIFFLSPAQRVDPGADHSNSCVQESNRLVRITKSPVEITKPRVRGANRGVGITDRGMRITNTSVRITDCRVKITHRPLRITNSPVRITHPPLSITERPGNGSESRDSRSGWVPRRPNRCKPLKRPRRWADEWG